ncbi:MAG: SurA N-terminal domain-containing protein [Elusimicrobia bacterium]|nr:SurA N-terminal domain-containing protein [Elusimicrobiota bacterium]
MIEFMRKKAKEILFVIAVIFIAGIFFMNYQRKATVALRINSDSIPYSEYYRTFSRALNNARDSSEKELTDKEVSRIKQSVIARLVQEQLIYQQAKKFGVKVSDDIVANAIMSMKTFQVDGKFNESVYKRALAMYYRMPVYEFEEEIRKSVARQFLRDIVLESAKITPFELRMEFSARFPGENLEEKKKDFANDLLSEKRSLIYYDWMNVLINKSKIKNNIPKLEGRK